MGKSFKGKACVCCATAPAATMNHVFAREFFLVDRRANLSKVPTCAACNGAKSSLEHYLTAVLPFGGRHADGLVHLTEMVPGRPANTRRSPASSARSIDKRGAWWGNTGDDNSLRSGQGRRAIRPHRERPVVASLAGSAATSRVWCPGRDALRCWREGPRRRTVHDLPGSRQRPSCQWHIQLSPFGVSSRSGWIACSDLP
jgi:hypothetical protein